MYSAFGVDHDGISKSDERRERAQHYGRMSATLGTLGATSAGVGAGSAVVGSMERKGKDPMGFTQRAEFNQPKLQTKHKARILRKVSRAHGWQARTLGGLGAASGAMSAGYHAKKKKELKGISKREKRDTGSQVGLGTGAAAAGGAALGQGAAHAALLGGQAKIGADEARSSHHLLASQKMGDLDMGKKERKFHLKRRKVGARVAGLKSAGAVGAGTAAAAGGAGLYELGRYHLKRKK